VLSASKEIELGARAMLVLAEDLFRIDLTITSDTLRTVVRNLSSGELTIDGSLGSSTPDVVVFGEAGSFHPSQTRIDFTLGSGDERVRTEVLIGTLHFHDRGTVRVTAQAIVREGSQTPS
jgi:hypothetical protein